MADVKAKRRRNFSQPKFPVYQALHNINAAFQTLAYEIERLDDSEAIPLDTLRLYRTSAEELRSAMNHHITEALWIREEYDWAHYGRQKAAAEKRLK